MRYCSEDMKCIKGVGCHDACIGLRCLKFGRLDGMNGSCHYCLEQDKELFEVCWKESHKNDIEKKERQ